MVVAIDFDGVIHDHKNPLPNRRMGKPITGTQKALLYFRREGYKIIVFSVWGDDEGRKTIADFMKYYKLSYDEITNIKPQADYYIDDRGIRFFSWQNTLSIIHEK